MDLYPGTRSITVTAPVTVANLGAGFDLLGLALDIPGDTIIATPIPEKILRFTSDPAFPELPSDDQNVAFHVGKKVFDAISPASGAHLQLIKKIPPGSGMGGSAASCAAAAVSVNALFGNVFSRQELLPFAVHGERLASGSPHADNVAPALLGGLCLLSPGKQMEVLQLPIHEGFYWSVVLPAFACNTREMRELLPKMLSLATHTLQAGCLASLVAGLLTGQSEWVSRGLHDLIAEPARASRIPGFARVREAALDAGALGCGISGSGPALFALSDSKITADQAASAMQEAFHQAGLISASYVSGVSLHGTLCREQTA